MSDLQKENLFFWATGLGTLVLLVVTIISIAYEIMPIVYIVLTGCMCMLCYIIAYNLWCAVYRWRIMGALKQSEYYVYALWSDSICFGDFDEIRKKMPLTRDLEVLEKIERVKRPNWYVFK